MATIAQVNDYISSMRIAVADYTNSVMIKETLGHTDLFCNRQKVMLLSAFLDCVNDYFGPFLTAGVEDHSYDTDNFFTTDEIMDVMQHVNSICKTFYTLDL